MYERSESEYYQAKMKAARRMHRGWVKPVDLPSNAEIRDEIQSFARMHEGAARDANLRAMRVAALQWMRRFERFLPRLIGSVLTGHIRNGSDIDLHLFADSIDPIVRALEERGIVHDVELKRVRKQGEERVYIHVRFVDEFPFEVTIYPSNLANTVSKSSITGKPIERASIAELTEFLRQTYPELDVEAAAEDVEDRPTSFLVFESLLAPLENVKQNPKYHPEGDALFHSLQVFEHARDALPYDEEFLTAALLHDVGKAIDPGDHVAAALEALHGFISERTAWLIAHHMEAHQLRDGTLGARARRRLQQSESFEELVCLAECDAAGRRPGANAPELGEALDYLRGLGRMFD